MIKIKKMRTRLLKRVRRKYRIVSETIEGCKYYYVEYKYYSNGWRAISIFRESFKEVLNDYHSRMISQIPKLNDKYNGRKIEVVHP